MITWIISLHFLLLFVLFAVYAERKTAAFIQDRLGPYEVGPYGLLQPVADILKLLRKETIQPTSAYSRLFFWAPILPFIAVLSTFACIPVFSQLDLVEAPNLVLLVVALLSLEVVGILLAGWASGSKFSTYGAFRAVGQMIAYEVPLGFSLVAVVICTQSLDFYEIAQAQSPDTSAKIFGVLSINSTQIGGFCTWYILRNPLLPLVFVIFFIANLAQSHRIPFDLPEAESEIVAGYHTEYSGFRWALFMLAEYGVMCVLAILMTWVFLGAGYSPLPNIGSLSLSILTNDSEKPTYWFSVWLLLKVGVLVWIQMWIRWSLPRLTLDQILTLCWKYLTPIAVLLVYLTALWEILLYN